MTFLVIVAMKDGRRIVGKESTESMWGLFKDIECRIAKWSEYPNVEGWWLERVDETS